MDFLTTEKIKTMLIYQSNHNYRRRMVTTINKNKNKKPRNKAPNNPRVASLDAEDSMQDYFMVVLTLGVTKGKF